MSLMSSVGTRVLTMYNYAFSELSSSSHTGVRHSHKSVQCNLIKQALLASQAAKTRRRRPTSTPPGLTKAEGGLPRHIVLVASLSFVEAPLDCRDTWQRTCDELAESDLDGSQDDYDLCFGLFRKRPYALAFKFCCGSKSVPRLEH